MRKDSNSKKMKGEGFNQVKKALITRNSTPGEPTPEGAKVKNKHKRP